MALKRHTGSPSAREWRHLEVQRDYPDFRWQRPFTFDGYFYLHAVNLSSRCNFDHPIVA